MAGEGPIHLNGKLMPGAQPPRMAEVERVLDRAARRLLAEQLAEQAAGKAPSQREGDPSSSEEAG